jgi:hypothetical protein
MAVNFSELLDAKRIRPLWGTGRGVATSKETDAKRPGEELDEEADAAAKLAKREGDMEHDDARSEPPTRESPTQVLNKIERMLYVVLGPQAVLLQAYMQPLRKVLYRLEGNPPPPHPLAHAFQTGNLPMLIYRLEDSFRGLLRAKQKLLK